MGAAKCVMVTRAAKIHKILLLGGQGKGRQKGWWVRLMTRDRTERRSRGDPALCHLGKQVRGRQQRW